MLNCRLTFKVGDVFAARISEPKSLKTFLTRLLGSQGSKNVGGGRRGNGASHDLADRNPVGGACRRRSANRLLSDRKTPYPIIS